MLVKLENPVLLSKSIDLISELVTEVRIKVNEFGMSISAMDPANVAMVGFKLPKSAFSEFEADHESLGVNLDDLKRILKRGGTGSSLILEKKENLLEIQILDKIKRNFSLALIDVESEDIDFESKVANMEFSSKVELNSEDLLQKGKQLRQETIDKLTNLPPDDFIFFLNYKKYFALSPKKHCFF